MITLRIDYVDYLIQYKFISKWYCNIQSREHLFLTFPDIYLSSTINFLCSARISFHWYHHFSEAHKQELIMAEVWYRYFLVIYSSSNFNFLWRNINCYVPLFFFRKFWHEFCIIFLENSFNLNYINYALFVDNRLAAFLEWKWKKICQPNFHYFRNLLSLAPILAKYYFITKIVNQNRRFVMLFFSWD